MAGSSPFSQSTQSILPISEISSYQNRFTIKARVTNKSDVRTFSKGNNPGKVFSVDLLDREGGEIRASFFNQGADQFVDLLQPGRCYLFSRCSVKVANRQYNNCNHRYELTFDKDALVTEERDDVEIQTAKFTFSDLRTVQSMVLPCKVDLCGVVVSVQPCLSFTSKDGKELTKRELTLADDTSLTMDVTIWGDRAKESDSKFEGHVILGLKGVFVKEWNGGRAGSLLSGGAIVFQPEEPHAKRVREWWAEHGKGQNLSTLSNKGAGIGGAARNARHLSLPEMREAAEKLGDQSEMYSTVARLALVQTTKQGEPQPLTYLACCEPREGSNGLLCNKRVDESGVCPSCGRIGKVAVRMNLRCRFVDAEDGVWLTTFHEAAQQVLGITAEELHVAEKEARENGEGGREALQARIKAQYFAKPLQVTVRAKVDTYNGEARTNVTCVSAGAVQPVESGRKMLAEIESMLSAAGA
eukprot:CAMPEP_0194503094 /NCGR_PEP_ID=MMETSP0253-20130528/28191_1 /TAXON_ID=2966 /ORGANISM="Noctiluca scintillans" /LENGTH=469 /DNA_ID=CAMNT_0039345345 /DNA_START=60 /DNA_END=1469 /DNA_ORIENTATION=+